MTEPGYPEINRLIGSNDEQGHAGAQFAKEQGFSKVYIVAQKEPYGFRNAEDFLDDLNDASLYGPEELSLLAGGGLYYTIMNVPAQFYPDSAKFIQDFNIHYGTDPLLLAARPYDATGICISAIENASNQRGGAVPKREQVAHAIWNQNLTIVLYDIARQ